MNGVLDVQNSVLFRLIIFKSYFYAFLSIYIFGKLGKAERSYINFWKKLLKCKKSPKKILIL